jgi:exonuclease III
MLNRKKVTNGESGGTKIMSDIMEALSLKDAFQEVNGDLEKYTWAAKPYRREKGQKTRIDMWLTSNIKET